MLKTKYIRLCQATLLDKNEKCMNKLQFAEDACTDVATPKQRLLSGKHGEEYDCNMCKEKHKYADASFAYQQDLFWDTEKSPDAPMVTFSKRGEDEFIIKALFKNEDLLKPPSEQKNLIRRFPQ